MRGRWGEHLGRKTSGSDMVKKEAEKTGLCGGKPDPPISKKGAINSNAKTEKWGKKGKMEKEYMGGTWGGKKTPPLAYLSKQTQEKREKKRGPEGPPKGSDTIRWGGAFERD